MYYEKPKLGTKQFNTCSKIFVGKRPKYRRRNKLYKRQFLEEKSDKLSKRPTGAEMELAKKLDELNAIYEFQRVVRYKGLDFIYDFHVIKPRKVFIEVDGGYHETDEQKQTDRIKDFVCQKCLFQKIVRFTNEEAINMSVEEVAEKLNFKEQKT